MRETKYFDRLFREYYKPLLFYALRFVEDQEDCHDIVMAVFEEVWRNHESLSAETTKAFLYTIVRNKCIDYLRRQNLHSRYVTYTELMSRGYSEDHHEWESYEKNNTIKKVLDQIGSPTREILEACYLQEKKYKEVAEEMQISVATVKKHMVRALKMLREIKKTLKA